MRRSLCIGLMILSFPLSAGAVTCANGVYRAGCVGPNGAAAVNKQTGATRSTTTNTVHCASGVYRAGCAGPNGAAVIRR